MAAMGLAFTIKDDADFESLSAENRKVIEDLTSANRVPINASTAAFTIPEEELIPEGVTHDPFTGKFYVGSTHKAKSSPSTKTEQLAIFRRLPTAFGALQEWRSMQNAVFSGRASTLTPR